MFMRPSNVRKQRTDGYGYTQFIGVLLSLSSSTAPFDIHGRHIHRDHCAVGAHPEAKVPRRSQALAAAARCSDLTIISI